MARNPSQPRVFHLLGRPPDVQTARAIEALTHKAGHRTEVAHIGRGGDWRHVVSARFGLRRRAREFDLVQCWDDRAVTAAISAGVPTTVISSQQFPTARHVGWLRAAMAYREVQIVCPSATVRRFYAERGISLNFTHLVRPGVDFGRIKKRRDPALRTALGIEGDDFVILVPGESTDAADHHLAVWAGTMLACLDQRYRILMMGRGPRAATAMALGPKMGQHRLVISADERLGTGYDIEALTSAADMAMITATGGGGTPCSPKNAAASTLPVIAAMASALPIVSVVTPTLAELLEDRHTALMVTAPKARLLAAKVLALRDDPALARQIADTAAAEAYKLLSLSKFRQGWAETYEKIMAEYITDDDRSPARRSAESQPFRTKQSRRRSKGRR